MNPNILSLAERIIRQSDRDHPADAVLRQELKNERRLFQDDAGQISRMVFSYFRWRAWLEERHELRDQIIRAVELATEFAERPQGFADSVLVSRAVPAWVHEELEITPALARSLNTEPKLWLRARPGQGESLSQRLQQCRPFGNGLLGDILEYQGHEDLFRTAEFHAGEFELQDISSQAVALVCGPEPGQTWWDACTGEGGKMLHLSDLMKNKGLIWATDRAEWRLRRLKRRAARAKVFNYRTAVWDGGAKLPTKTKFDGVLIDAPCSGIGTWQRNPHAKWTLTPEDLKELNGLQTQLLDRAASLVKPGGKVVYAVCSLARSETDTVSDRFESSGLPFKPLPLKNPLTTGSPETTRLVLLPQQFGGNGMFIAAWMRKA